MIPFGWIATSPSVQSTAAGGAAAAAAAGEGGAAGSAAQLVSKYHYYNHQCKCLLYTTIYSYICSRRLTHLFVDFR